VIVELVDKRGVTPELTLMFGVKVPETSSFPVPLEAVPTPKCVSVAVPPVHCGASTFDAGDTLLFVTVQPELDLATATRAYEVYAASFVVWSPASPGSAV
jgi:hypothetical protein